MDVEAFIQADMAFHAATVEITGNPIFMAVSNAMLNWLANFHTSTTGKGNEHATLEEHARFLEAIRAHVEAAAVGGMRAHFDRARTLYALT